MIWNILVVVVTIVTKSLETLEVDLAGLVKQTVAGNEGVLHNCSSDQDQVLQQCYIDMFQSYGSNVTSLPPADEDPFKKIRYDATGMCSTYTTLRHCHSDVINDCLNYNTFNAIFGSESNAAYYISQTGFLEFYCNYGNDFVAYYECMQAISLNDLSDTIYTECSVLEVGSCDSVSRTTQCERAVVRKSCGNSAVKSYCQYQKILTHMTGWNFCEYMPCINSSQPRTFFFLIILMYLCKIFV
ncbi:DUF19 domain-containing protein [Caenorhabditis elegans]|uniref:DUF19 domain-containing protein n=1 Tax=Caenorhabditis elegans TaxID=6239 RepID=Q2XN49_CAEEL|nr:DUF19 domain-containing protein [Caenorhabditis elegans]CCD66121.1 DUF19 domain-containing protein [Caenorhabditis elegans]|eukprot:NP_001022104.1 Uncharacterized protein CELE_F21H12.7 [Caenorhabditis elegans]